MIRVTYADGRVEQQTWHANRMSADSNVIGNLRSRPAFRAGAWQQNGISSVEVSVPGTFGLDEVSLIREQRKTDERQVADLVELGESRVLEFKSTLQWDVVRSERNKGLRHASLKTLNAFVNTHGGTLVIGVEDAGEIYGLERDLSLTHHSRDRFEQLLISLIADSMGATTVPLCRIRFEDVGDKSVCVVDVEHAPGPIVMKTDSGKAFYIRTGNTSRALDHEETLKYVEAHW